MFRKSLDGILSSFQKTADDLQKLIADNDAAARKIEGQRLALLGEQNMLDSESLKATKVLGSINAIINPGV